MLVKEKVQPYHLNAERPMACLAVGFITTERPESPTLPHSVETGHAVKRTALPAASSLWTEMHIRLIRSDVVLANIG